MLDKLDKIQAWATAGLVVWGVLVAGYALLQDRWLDDMRRERDAAILQRHAAERAIIVLADQHAEELARKTASTAAREDILAMDVSNEPPIAESVQAALQAAEAMRGMK